MATSQTEPFHVLLADSTLFQNVTYAIGQIHFSKVPAHGTRAYAQANEEIQKHVSLLDHVVLLLVFKPKGDVVATGLLREQNGFTIVWSKNQNYLMPSTETNYVHSLTNAFKNLQPPLEILKIVVGNCAAKILARVKKLVAAVAATAPDQSKNFFGIIENHPLTELMRQFLVQDQLMGDQSLADGLDSFLKVTRDLTKNSSPDAFVKVLAFAYWLTLNDTERDPKLDIVPGVNHILFRRVQKLGAYFQACVKIHRAVQKLSPAVRNNINTEQLSPPTIQPFRPFSNTIIALNTWTERLRLRAFDDFSVVENYYKNAHPGAPGQGTHEIAAAQHCVLTVGLTVWQRNEKTGNLSTVEIGCSKQSCFYCSLYIDKFNEWARSQTGSRAGSPQIVLRGQHNKYVQGWAMPPQGPTTVRNNVLDVIGQTMQEIHLEAGGPRRKSDSQSPPSKTQGADEAAKLKQNAMLGSQSFF
ncbi:MAG: hypothetical protein Q9226_001518 [Calogaya cf. arnoldii]